MIVRIKIDGFKSLVDTELYLGPFTCIAGANAIGKSNFFDALQFLSKLADGTLLQAAKSVRSENQKHLDIRDIFFRNGNDFFKEMAFEVDLLVPQMGTDDLGQQANATITSLRYSLILGLNPVDSLEKEPIEIIKEELRAIPLSEARKGIFFDYQDTWLNSVLKGRKLSRYPFISSLDGKVRLHQDGNQGRTADFIAKNMPRTLLSTVTAESPTAFLVRQEMRNWAMLQFEPSALRQPNTIFEVKNAKINANGLNLPATLYRLKEERKEIDVYQSLTNKLKALVGETQEIYIDHDQKRDLLTLFVKFKGDLALPAQSLSDGTLRFLGLAVMDADSSHSGLICLEEPENGINPKKIPHMVGLLEGMAVDTFYEVGPDNPFRQVIINTHSPLVVKMVSKESLYLAKFQEKYLEKWQRKINRTCFVAIEDTWKTNNNLVSTTTPGEIMSNLGNDPPEVEPFDTNTLYEKQNTNKRRKRTVGGYIESSLNLFSNND
jgi:predicted ATPase